MADLESPEAFVTRMHRDATDSEFKLDEDVVVEMVAARDEAIRADERAKVVQRIAKLESEAEEVRERLQTVVDERIEIEPVLTTDELITIVEHALAKWNRRILELEAKVEAEQWISVGERLPEEHGTVLAIETGGELPMRCVYHDSTWYNVDNGSSYDVTHWRPLPAPPTDAERKDGAT